MINLAPDKPAVFREIARVLKPGGRLAVSDIALKAELLEAVASSLAAYVGCIAGAIRIETYRAELLKAGFEYVEIVDTGTAPNAYKKVENQAGCCSPAMETSGLFAVVQEACCTLSPSTLHADLSSLLDSYDVKQAQLASRSIPSTQERHPDVSLHTQCESAWLTASLRIAF